MEEVEIDPKEATDGERRLLHRADSCNAEVFNASMPTLLRSGSAWPVPSLVA